MVFCPTYCRVLGSAEPGTSIYTTCNRVVFFLLHSPHMTINEVREALKPYEERGYKEGQYRFFKEEITLHGVRAKHVELVAKQLFPEIKFLSQKAFNRICEKLIATGYQEETFIAYQWLWRRRKELIESDFLFLSSIIKKHTDNWAKVDGFCTNVFGYFLTKYPTFMQEVKTWVTSKNRWVRRASAVSFIYPVRYEKKYLADIFEVSDALLLDEDDLVRKGYGWMLKEASNVFPKEVFAYVLKRKDVMPRVALRYAIEKMPKEWKREAMAIQK